MHILLREISYFKSPTMFLRARGRRSMETNNEEAWRPITIGLKGPDKSNGLHM
jgi:hypothetical protein